MMTIADLKTRQPNYTAEQIARRLEQAGERSRERKLKQYTSALAVLGELGEYRNIKKLLSSRIKELSE